MPEKSSLEEKLILLEKANLEEENSNDTLSTHRRTSLSVSMLMAGKKNQLQKLKEDITDRDKRICDLVAEKKSLKIMMKEMDSQLESLNKNYKEKANELDYIQKSIEIKDIDAINEIKELKKNSEYYKNLYESSIKHVDHWKE